MINEKTIIRHIRKFIDLSESEVVVFTKYVETHQLKKKEFIIQEGSVCKQLYFVEKGCLRMYFINKKGVEQITQFALDGWWISDYQSFMNKTPSDYYIQAIEESTIEYIGNQSLERMLIELPRLERYFRIIMQKAVAGAQHRSEFKTQRRWKQKYKCWKL